MFDIRRDVHSVSPLYCDSGSRVWLAVATQKYLSNVRYEHRSRAHPLNSDIRERPAGRCHSVTASPASPRPPQGGRAAHACPATDRDGHRSSAVTGRAASSERKAWWLQTGSKPSPTELRNDHRAPSLSGRPTRASDVLPVPQRRTGVPGSLHRTARVTLVVRGAHVSSEKGQQEIHGDRFS